MAELLEFEPVEHIYRLCGRKLPSVTQVLSVIDTFEGVPMAFLEAARDFGRHVHAAVHLCNTNDLDHESLDPALVPYLEGWVNFLKDSGARVIESERRVYSRALGIAGTLDCLLDWHSLAEVADVKTGAAVPRSVGLQTAAYRQLRKLEGDIHIGRKRYCIHLLGKGRYKVHALDDPSDWDNFLSCLNVWKFINKR
jgi:hypothetical protein